eukprot:CAMPEP_0172533930 /NCGR_PEP_ID=MMETSP1067-20121228/6474_1 /TAXON_ID=265564 ORGANISM="Thalassiosira punctigera, Strain Tpunct2005C2" /NCGR_SAMPLE_ID=MMETSP1067 /ASSEMBLY_ACC=CAM_ASM_000444 /LENGTH=473 /DNA_ID=CAMNT_0013318651 /DNA_START=52 /DNA_END=1473 /DNA_ORIENTATION=-
MKQNQQQEQGKDDETSATSSSEAEEMADGGASSGSGSDGDSDSDGDGDEGSSGPSESESGSDDQNDDAEGQNSSTRAIDDSNTSGGEQCTFDLANLLAMNTHQVNAAELYRRDDRAPSSKTDEWYGGALTIPATTGVASVNEPLLLAKAAEGTTQLLRELWRLPAEKTDVGPMARLPSSETKLPRSLPPPPPKQLSKWEQFALQRGIAPKSKRSRKVFDESTGEWKHLTGSLQNKANAGPESWPIMEVKKNDDPMADPWERLREEKKGRVNKNVEARMRNAERAGTLERGGANKLSKNNKRLEKQREVARERERRQGLVAPVGVPLDVKSDQRRGKPSTQLALRATQVSTASLGKFDKQREGEPEKKQMSKFSSIRGDKKRKQLDDGGGNGGGGTNKKFLQSEAQKSADILHRVMDGSASKEKERDVKRGKYARGETGYDYEFDDGLGSSSFKKKKGRAGMGKMRKVTKKRIK